MRPLRLFLVALVATIAFPLLSAPAHAAKGECSVGGNLGVGIYSMSAANDSLEAEGLEKISSGWEFGGSFRYQVSEKAALDIEVSALNPKSTTTESGFPDIVFKTPALAIPLSLIYRLSENDQYRFNFVVGGGLISGAKIKGDDGTFSIESDSKSSAFGQAGFETEWLVSPKFALTARALGRLSGKPEVTIEGSDVELDYTGAVFGVGARVLFGGGQ